MRNVLIILLIILLISFAYAIGLNHRGIPLDFKTFEYNNMTFVCSFWGALSHNCVEVNFNGTKN